MHKLSVNVGTRFVREAFMKSAKGGEYNDEVLLTVIRVLSDHLAAKDLEYIVTIHNYVKPKLNTYWENRFKAQRGIKRKALDELNERQNRKEV